jgi:hypothetical protein
MSKPTRFSDLSPARQALVRLCQTLNFGSIEDLKVEHAEPVFDPPPVILKEVKLDSDEGSREELAMADFAVTDEIVRLITRLDEIQRGILRRIEVRTGIPRRIVIESRMLGVPERLGLAGILPETIHEPSSGWKQ